MKYNLGYKVFFFSFLLLFNHTVSLYANSFLDSPHFDKTKLLKGCASCHKGHGVKNTPMLSDDKDSFCFRCHGNIVTVERTRKSGYLASNTKGYDIQLAFEKTYRHPIEKTGIHHYDETLPETTPSAPRHAECVDCHHHHYAGAGDKMRGMKGVNRSGLTVERIEAEYELCFKCHSYSANLPGDQRNKAELFSVSNPSYHPVVSQGRNAIVVPSLLPPLSTSSLIKCTDCHNNDNPLGPKGPHGSNYRYILSKNFNDIDGPESPFQYELCYSCHRRNSILGNESFTYHDFHISTVGTSCRTCHAPHGSTLYPHLLDFNNLSISPSSSGRLAFIALGSKAGECFLTCHNKDHNPGAYPIKTSNPSLQRLRR
jgi:predicted CXXCH cytochrome family protein